MPLRPYVTLGVSLLLTLASAFWFDAESGRAAALVILLVGLTLSGVLFGVTRAELRARLRAERVAAELRDSQEALRESEERSRLTLARALDAVVTIDIEGRVINWNPQAEQLFGWPAADILQRRLSETIIPPAYREAHERGLARFRETGEGPALNRRLELSALRRDGTEFPVELTITPVRLQGSTVFSAFLRDITQQKQAQEALRESEASFRLLFSNNPLPMWVYDVETLDFLEVNATAVAQYGYSREEFLRKRISDIRPAEDVERLKEVVAKLPPVTDETRRDTGPWKHRLKDGRVIDVDIVSHAMDFSGRRAALVIATDVTELKRSPRRVRRAAQHPA